MAGKSGVILNRTCIPKDRVHSVALICGDMGRFMMFKEHATHYREFGQYLCWKAAEIEVDGEMLLIACHGVGSQPAAVLIKELIELGVKCIIRSGTSGTYMPREHGIGDICIVYGAVRGDTISLNEVDAAYPAVADPDVVEALRESSKELNVSTHMGIAYTTDLFYRTGILGEDPRIPLIDQNRLSQLKEWFESARNSNKVFKTMKPQTQAARESYEPSDIANVLTKTKVSQHYNYRIDLTGGLCPEC